MKTRIFLTFFVLFSSFNFVFSQTKKSHSSTDIELLWGESFRMPKKHYQLDFTGSPEDGYANICYRQKKSIAIQRFDKNLKFKKEDVYEIKEKKPPIVEGSIKMNNRFYVKEIKRDRKADKTSVIIREVDLATGKLSAERVLCESTSRGSNFNTLYSIHKDYMLLYYLKPKESVRDSKNFETYSFTVFNKELKKVWSKDVRLPYPESEIKAQDFTLTSSGELYMLMSRKNANEGKRVRGSKDTDVEGKAVSNFGMELYKVDPNDYEMDKVKVKFNPKFYYSSNSIFETKNDQLLLVSLYSSSKYDSYDGLSVMTFNKEAGEFEESNLYEIPTALIKEFESAKQKKRMEKDSKKKGDSDEEAASLNLRTAIMDANGNLFITAEQYKLIVVTHTRTDSRGGSYTTYSYHYYYEDVYIFKISKDKTLEWIKKIPKDQRAVNTTTTLGIHSFVAGDDYYLVYFDKAENLRLESNKNPEVYFPGKGILCYTKIDKEGVISKEKLFDVKEQERYLEVTDFERVAESTFLTTAFFKKDKNPVILRLKD